MGMAEAATIPLAAVTAGVVLWRELSVPWPWTAGPREPIVIYGASSAVGAFGVKLAKTAGSSPVIAITGGGHGYVEKLLDSETDDRVVDYRNGDEAIPEAIKAALNGRSVKLGTRCHIHNQQRKDIGKGPQSNIRHGEDRNSPSDKPGG